MFPLFSVLIPNLYRPDGRLPTNEMGHSSCQVQVCRPVACTLHNLSPGPFFLGTDNCARDESP